MNPAHQSLPSSVAGYWVWPQEDSGIKLLFVGRGPQPEQRQTLCDLTDGRPQRLAWLRQIHSATVVQAGEGLCGEGDALVTQEHELALSVATADCLPIVLAGPRRLAAVHAGWRGLIGGIIAQTLASLNEDPSALRAWIGPAIGLCCYEVGVEVARQVAEVSGVQVIRGGVDRPHVDLALAAQLQLAAAGVEAVETLTVCTRCSPAWLWSYRREGVGAGRNWTFTWRPVSG